MTSMRRSHRANAVLTTGQNAHYNSINPRGCPGSHARVRKDEHGRGVCPFCGNDFRVRNDGKISAHVRRS